MPKDHPRLCGEKAAKKQLETRKLGSPPLVRGKVWKHLSRQAEKRDHPRLCGEKIVYFIFHYPYLGSPPLVRGKANPQRGHQLFGGITPACAGKRLKKSKNTYDPKCPVSAFHSVFQTQQMSGDNPQAHDAMQKRPFRNGMRVSSIYNPKQDQVFFLPFEAYRHRGF